MVVDFFTLERIILGAFNRISVCSGAAGHKISDATVLMAFVIMHVSRENDYPNAQALLPRFQHLGKLLLLRSGGVASPKHFGVGRTSVGRMMKND
jgi:hypothetical protein